MVSHEKKTFSRAAIIALNNNWCCGGICICIWMKSNKSHIGILRSSAELMSMCVFGCFLGSFVYFDRTKVAIYRYFHIYKELSYSFVCYFALFLCVASVYNLYRPKRKTTRSMISHMKCHCVVVLTTICWKSCEIFGSCIAKTHCGTFLIPRYQENTKIWSNQLVCVCVWKTERERKKSKPAICAVRTHIHITWFNRIK